MHPSVELLRVVGVQSAPPPTVSGDYYVALWADWPTLSTLVWQSYASERPGNDWFMEVKVDPKTGQIGGINSYKPPEVADTVVLSAVGETPGVPVVDLTPFDLNVTKLGGNRPPEFNMRSFVGQPALYRDEHDLVFSFDGPVSVVRWVTSGPVAFGISQDLRLSACRIDSRVLPAESALADPVAGHTQPEP